MEKSGCVFVPDKVTWRIGGLRSASVGSAWISSEGRTGFYRGNRKIEEPNPLSKAFRQYFAEGLNAKVDAVPGSFDNHDDLIDQIIQQSDAMTENCLVTFFVPAEFWCPVHWFLLDCRHQLTPRESWLVESNVDALRPSGMILTDD